MTLGPSAEEIVARYRLRAQQAGVLHSRMRDVRDAYNGDLIVPLPEMDRNERSAVANLVQSGLDQMAMRVASTVPDVYYPPKQVGQDKAERYADIRRRANLGWWEMNRMGLKLRRRARHLIGYAATPVVLHYDCERHIPVWHTRNPLSAYPPVDPDPDSITPSDMIFAYRRHLGHLAAEHPQVADQLGMADGSAEVVEYQDADVTVLLALVTEEAPPQPSLPPWMPPQAAPDPEPRLVELVRCPNPTGVCLAVMPGRVTLDLALGQFDGILGMTQAAAKLMALDMIAVERSTFPDLYLVGRPQEEPAFVQGPYDGRTGQVNVVSGGAIQTTTGQPSLQAQQMLDRLERNSRVSAGVPAEFGGESPGNVRTGKRGDAVMSAVVDFPVQEAQELLAASLTEENRRAVALVKCYANDRKMSFHVSWKGAVGHVDYTPSQQFDTDWNVCTYPQSGTDLNSLVVGIGQRVGLGTLSKFNAMQLDPMIDDARLEKDRITSEQLETAALGAIVMQAQQGAMPITDVAEIANAVKVDRVDLFTAIQQVQAKAQQRQAEQVPQGSPETQPGLNQPGQGGEQPTIPAENMSLANFKSLLQGLNTPQGAAASVAQRSNLTNQASGPNQTAAAAAGMTPG